MDFSGHRPESAPPESSDGTEPELSLQTDLCPAKWAETMEWWKCNRRISGREGRGGTGVRGGTPDMATVIG